MKLVFLLVSFIATTAYCQTSISSNNPIIDSFISSPTFERINSFYNTNNQGTVDLRNSTVVYLERGNTNPVINIIIMKDSIPQGVLEAIPLPERSTRKLPYGDRYLMQYNDYSGFNFKTSSGTIKTYDVNYENYQSTNITISNDSIKQFTYLPMPNDVASRHAMDLNNNGNVGWGECMRYAQTACLATSECTILCSILNVAGYWASPRAGGACTVSMAAACVYIAWKY